MTLHDLWMILWMIFGRPPEMAREPKSLLTLNRQAKRIAGSYVRGGVPKRPTGADCKSAGLCLRRFESYPLHHLCGCSSMVEPQPSKLMVWVRFPSPAPLSHREKWSCSADERFFADLDF